MSRSKQKRRAYTPEFKRQALERMKASENIVQLAEELGIARPLLYQWEAASEGRGRRKGKPGSLPVPELNPSEEQMREELLWLRKAFTQKSQEVDFFKAALQRVEVPRRNNAGSVGTASTTKSAK